MPSFPEERIVEVPSQDYVIEIQFPSQRDRPALLARCRSHRHVVEFPAETTEEGRIGRGDQITPDARALSRSGHVSRPNATDVPWIESY
jgi:hypothetical protein